MVLTVFNASVKPFQLKWIIIWWLQSTSIWILSGSCAGIKVGVRAVDGCKIHCQFEGSCTNQLNMTVTLLTSFLTKKFLNSQFLTLTRPLRIDLEVDLRNESRSIRFEFFESLENMTLFFIRGRGWGSKWKKYFDIFQGYHFKVLEVWGLPWDEDHC